MHEILKEELDKNIKLWDATAARNTDNITYDDYSYDTNSEDIEIISDSGSE
jgi:hypothetical protein